MIVLISCELSRREEEYTLGCEACPFWSCLLFGVRQTGVLQPLIPLEAARRLCVAGWCLPSLCSGATWMNPQSAGLGSLLCRCPAVMKGLFSLENDFRPLVSCRKRLHTGGMSMVALSADIPLWQPVKMRWDKPDKRCPCSVIGALIISHGWGDGTCRTIFTDLRFPTLLGYLCLPIVNPYSLTILSLFYSFVSIFNPFNLRMLINSLYRMLMW